MMGLIGFQDLKVNCIIGVNPEERLKKQEILISLQVQVDVSAVAQTDDLRYAANYVSLADDCKNIAITHQFKMIETLAEAILKHLEERYRLSWMKVMIKKPKAIPEASFTFVELEKKIIGEK
jgi:dihydroneopterin aldolase